MGRGGGGGVRKRGWRGLVVSFRKYLYYDALFNNAPDV